MTDTTTAARPAHTPGPWFVVEGNNGSWPGGCEIAIDDAEGGNEERDYYLASVVHGDPDELLANARLIAASPELLEALHQLIVVIGLTAIKYKSDLDMLQAAVDEARAVIAKATGSAS